MFNSKLPSDINPGVTIISKGCSFEGKLFCRGISRIGGKISGEIISQGTLIVEKEAEVIANIQSDVLIIQGKVNGNIDAETKIEVKSTSNVDGSIYSPSIMVEEGSSINAAVSMIKKAKDIEQNGLKDQDDHKHDKKSLESKSPDDDLDLNKTNEPVDITKELNQRKSKSKTKLINNNVKLRSNASKE